MLPTEVAGDNVIEIGQVRLAYLFSRQSQAMYFLDSTYLAAKDFVGVEIDVV